MDDLYSDYELADDLPPEAIDRASQIFEPNENWLRSASPELQIEAMRRWFYARFEDPANDTPYDGREGGYQFIWGGPYDPNDEIQDRFGEIVPYEVMEQLIAELWETGDEWAPISDYMDYDEFFIQEIENESSPYNALTRQLAQLNQILDINQSQDISQLIFQMVHSSAISSLEAYLADTVRYWIENSEEILENFVSTNKDFSSVTIPLNKIYKRLSTIREDVENKIQNLIWHRLDKVKHIIEGSFGFPMPKIDDLMRDIVVRHDIVHRGGKTKQGSPVCITVEMAINTINNVRIFVEEMEESIRNMKNFDL